LAESPNDTTYPSPADGDAPRLTGNVIGIKVPPQDITITQQPADATVAATTVATFTVAATTTGFYPPTYQWQKGTSDISGATGATLNWLASAADDGSTFRCVVSIFGQPPTVTSQSATLHVTAAPPKLTKITYKVGPPATVHIEWTGGGLLENGGRPEWNLEPHGPEQPS